MITKEDFAKAATGSKILDSENQTWIFSDDPYDDINLNVEEPIRALIPPEGVFDLEEGQTNILVILTEHWGEHRRFLDSKDNGYLENLCGKETKLVA